MVIISLLNAYVATLLASTPYTGAIKLLNIIPIDLNRLSRGLSYLDYVRRRILGFGDWDVNK